MAAAALWPIRVLAEALLAASVVCALGALAALPRLFKSRYDLDSLRDVHEREALKLIVLDEPEEYDSVHCLNCGEAYNIRMPLCPRCGSDPGRPPCG